MNEKNENVEEVINKAIKKIGCLDENGIRHYLQVKPNVYMHHFTFRKVLKEDPKFLCEEIHKYILDVEKPKQINIKRRSVSSMKKVYLTDDEIRKILEIALFLKERGLFLKLKPKNYSKALKKSLIKSIVKGNIETSLWNEYVNSEFLRNKEE